MTLSEEAIDSIRSELHFRFRLFPILRKDGRFFNTKLAEQGVAYLTSQVLEAFDLHLSWKTLTPLINESSVSYVERILKVAHGTDNEFPSVSSVRNT